MSLPPALYEIEEGKHGCPDHRKNEDEVEQKCSEQERLVKRMRQRLAEQQVDKAVHRFASAGA